MTTTAIAPARPAFGHLIGVTGLPGTGKSHFARSARAAGRTRIALTDPKELSFYGEDGATVFGDLGWRPHANQFAATAFAALLAWCAERVTDDSEFVVIDTGSECSDLAMHEVLKVHATNDPGDIAHGRAYTAHDQQFKCLITELRRIAAAGKTVIVTFHGQMKELEGAGDAKKAKGISGDQEWKFDEQMLPVLCTSLRQRIHSPFDLWLYTVPVGFGPARQWFVTAQADAVRPAKSSVTWNAGVNTARIPNTLPALLAALAPATGAK